MYSYLKAVHSGNAINKVATGNGKKGGAGVRFATSVAGILLFGLLVSACSTPIRSVETSVPIHSVGPSATPTEFIDFMPLETGVFQQISLYFGYQVDIGPFGKQRIVIYHLDPEQQSKEPLAAINVDGVVVNEYSRKSVFAISWDEKSLLYINDLPTFAPPDLKSKPSGLYEYVHGRGDRLIYPSAGIISTSTFQLARNSLEFAMGDSSDPQTEHYVRRTDGAEFLQEEPFVMQHGGTVLHRAVAEGEIERVKELLETGLSLEITDNSGFTPLHIAIWKGQEEVAKLLIEQGADVNARIFGPLGWTPLEEAARFGLLDTITLLLEQGTDINSRTRTGVTPLHLAVDYKKWAVAELLVTRGANVNAKDNNGITPLHLFARGSRDERHQGWVGSQTESLLKQLLGKGVDIGALDDSGATPLHFAVVRNNLRTAKILIANGANAAAMELSNLHFHGEDFHHTGSQMTLQQRINDTLESVWWKDGAAESN